MNKRGKTKGSATGYVGIAGAVVAVLAVFIAARSCGGDSASPASTETSQLSMAGDPALEASPRPRPPPAVEPLDAGAAPLSDAAVIAGFAHAWSTEASIASFVDPEGLAVAVGDGPAVEFERSRLTDVRRHPPPFPDAECDTADLNMVAGVPVLAAYYAAGAKLSRWPSRRARWSDLRCYGLDAPDTVPARVCIRDTPEGPRVRALAVGLTDRPDKAEEIQKVEWLSKNPKVPARPPTELYNVVLVAEDDQLNARAEPDVNAAIVFQFPPKSKRIPGTGRRRVDQQIEWVQVQTPSGPGWVNRHYLARLRPERDLEADPRYSTALDELVASFERDDPPASLGRRGLYVMHFGAPLRVKGDDWASAMQSSRSFDGAACERCIDGTLSRIVGAELTDILRDANSTRVFGKMRRGANPSWLVPTEFSGFNTVAIFDPQDADCTGYDWKTAVFFFDEEDGKPTIVGVGFDAWSP